jgi:hypothetical protein
MDYQTRAVRRHSALLLRGPGSHRRRNGRAVLAIMACLGVLAAGCGSAVVPSRLDASRSGRGTDFAAGIGGLAELEGEGSLGARTAVPGKSGGAARTGTARSGVAGGALFGGTANLAQVQPQLGRKLAIARVYYKLGEPFPQAGDQQLMAAGTTLLVSLDTPQGGPSYASIAAGNYDATISAFLKAVDHAAVQYKLGAIYVDFEHEANDPVHHAGLGGPAEFVAAWDHIHQLAASEGLNWYQGGRLHWVLILTHVAYYNGQAQQFWPGSSEVDVIAVDGYNSGECRQATARNPTPKETVPESPGVLFDSALDFASHVGGLPVFISEWGSTSYALPKVQPGFINDMQAYVAAHPQIAGAMYWDDTKGGMCGYEVNNHPRSVAAMAAMGRSAAMQGTVDLGG